MAPLFKRKWQAWKTVIITAVVTLLIVGGAVALLLRDVSVRSAVAERLRPQREWPKRKEFRLRQVMLAARNQALARGELKTAAMINAGLSQEALMRAAAVQQAWMRKQDPKTRLFAQSRILPNWAYRNAGADLFGFLLQAGIRLNPSSVPALRQTLAAEAALVPHGELCRDVETATLVPLKQSHYQRIFSSSEYVKDGLLSVYERYGNEPVGARMMEVLDVVLAKSQEPSSFGMLPGKGSEENGNVLQACSRLSFSADRPAYAEMAARITDAVLTDMLPVTVGLPVAEFDYGAKKSLGDDVRLRDHGNEIVPGLSEAYALAVARIQEPQWKERADRWAEPLAAMYEKLVTEGCNSDGILISRMHPISKQPSNRVNDNWGYVLNGVLLFAQAGRIHGKISPERLAALEEAVDRISAATARTDAVEWQGEEMDGYADTLESGLYIAGHRPSLQPLLIPWVDDEIGLMYSCQKDSGLVTDGYLDGNFIRTALMYADQKSGGWIVDPWRPDVWVGFARNTSGEAALVVTADSAYSGVLRSDPPRHQTIMKLPWDWPRLNSWPEWCVLPDTATVVEADGLSDKPAIAELKAGLPLYLQAHGTISIRLESANDPSSSFTHAR